MEAQRIVELLITIHENERMKESLYSKYNWLLKFRPWPKV